jgi:hypothetical protein
MLFPDYYIAAKRLTAMENPAACSLWWVIHETLSLKNPSFEKTQLNSNPMIHHDGWPRAKPCPFRTKMLLPALLPLGHEENYLLPSLSQLCHWTLKTFPGRIYIADMGACETIPKASRIANAWL